MSQNRPRGRPRKEGANEAILAVARTMFGVRGYRDLTIDAIAEAAGVAKTTIYRRWPSKGSLLAAAIAPSGAPPASIEAVLAEVGHLLAPLASADDDAEILAVVRAILSTRRSALLALVPDPSRADELLGAIFMRLFVPEA